MTTTPATTTARGRVWAALRPDNRLLWVLIAVLIAAALYLSTVQTHINSSGHPLQISEVNLNTQLESIPSQVRAYIRWIQCSGTDEEGGNK